MLVFTKVVTWLLLLTFIYFNLFILAADAVIIGIYPYILGFTIIFGLLFLALRLIGNVIVVTILKSVLALVTILGILTFIQVWRNAKLLNGYQSNRSGYMDELMRMTHSKPEENFQHSHLEQGISKLIEKNTGMPLTYHNKAVLLVEGKEAFNEMLDAIFQAEHHIHIEFFIIKDDHIGEKFKKLLIQKAKEGVKVRIIYDGLGSYSLRSGFKKELTEAGVEIAIYDNVYQSILKGKINHRNHRKIIVIDGKVGFTGGVNIGDEYLSRDKNIGNWKDSQIKVEGEVVNWMQKIFLGDWYYVTGEKILDEIYFPVHEKGVYLPIQMITSGYDTHWNEISQLYFTLITSAQEKVYIATPYLVLSDSMIKALETAALRGVDVRIIIPKVPDLFLVGWANESFFGKLLKSGVKIYQYDNGFLHSKVFVIDEKILSIGSANFNTRSLYLDYEVNAVIFDENTAKKMMEELHRNIQDSQQVNREQHEGRSALQKLKEAIGKLAIPIT